MTIRRGARFAVAITMFVASSHPLAAQGRTGDAFAALGTDSVAWQRVLAYVVSAMSPGLVRAAADSSAQPWRLHLPAGEPQRTLLEAQLRRILRARPATSDDSVVHTLDVGALTILNDTARVKVSVGETRRCPGTTRTTGSGWTTTVLVRRHPQEQFWGAAFSRTTIAGDRVPC